ncbi:MAG: hypothetical protein MK183_10875 [Verrucomicrobiales bacterium]|nr:hypothetical protein [Verrucomicrobiales bacterium]
MITVDLRSIPEDDCLPFEGNLADDICQLPEKDAASVAGPLNYRAEASIVSGNLLFRGDFHLPFEFTCCRCNQPFHYTIRLLDHSLLVPVEDLSLIDLTDALREDIILALPNFPHCNDGDNQMDCPARGKFETEEDFVPINPEKARTKDSSSWDTLDKLKLD